MPSRRRNRRAEQQQGVLEDREYVTQYGNKIRPITAGQPFRRRPRPTDTDGLSMSAGRVDPLDAHKLVFAMTRLGDGVRYTTAGALRAEGFQVRRTPNPGNPEHVSVDVPQGGVWTEEHDRKFERCFTEEPLWAEVAVEEGKQHDAS